MQCKELLFFIDLHVSRLKFKFATKFKQIAYKTNIALKWPVFVINTNCLGEICHHAYMYSCNLLKKIVYIDKNIILMFCSQ